MFIEFLLPQDQQTYSVKHQELLNEINKWSTRYGIPYTQKTIKYTHRLAFDQDQHYTIFVTTWTSKMEYRLIDRRW